MTSIEKTRIGWPFHIIIINLLNSLQRSIILRHVLLLKRILWFIVKPSYVILVMLISRILYGEKNIFIVFLFYFVQLILSIQFIGLLFLSIQSGGCLFLLLFWSLRRSKVQFFSHLERVRSQFKMISL